jgi:dTDP-4-dehydrorhamnose 3,5-epimerase-like enzyme
MRHQIITPSFERTDKRGIFIEVLSTGRWEALIWGRMKPDAVIGNHYHKKTLIFFFLTKGVAKVSTVHVETGERDQFALKASQGVILKTNESHVIRFLEDSEFVMLKSIRYDPGDPDTFSYPVEESA